MLILCIVAFLISNHLCYSGGKQLKSSEYISVLLANIISDCRIQNKTEGKMQCLYYILLRF